MRDLLDIAGREEGEKSIVFSSWTDMLLVVSGALEKNDMRHVLCSKPSDFRGSNSKIEEFKHKHNINICVMPLSLGAEGLDLIAANNIFLLEPLLNPALETQALNRANRLGQTRITRVFKYITKDTVEEKILAFSENKKAGSDSCNGIQVTRMKHHLRRSY